MTNVLEIGVEVTLLPDGKIVWCSDWGFLVQVAHAGLDPRLTYKHQGPDTYGHVDYFWKET